MSRYKELCKERKELIERLKDITTQLQLADKSSHSMRLPFTNYPSIINNYIKEQFNRFKNKTEWAQKSKALGVTVRNQNQYELACMGANQEIIDTNVPSEVYELIVRHGK